MEKARQNDGAQGAESDGSIDGIEGMPTKLSDKILAGLDDDDIAMTVSRRLKGHKVAFLFELDEYEDMPSLLTLLRDKYDGGSFVIEGKRDNGQWAFKQGIEVEKPKQEKTQEKESHSAGDFQSVLLAMQQSSAEAAANNRDIMMQLNAAQTESMKSNMEMIVRMMEASKPAQTETTSITDIVGIFSQLQAMNPPKSDDSMVTFLKGLEFGKEMGGGSDDGVLQTALKTFGAPLVDMTKKLAEVRPSVPAKNAAPQQMPAQGSQLGIAEDAPALPPVLSNQETPGHEPSPENMSENDMNLFLLQKLKPTIETLAQGAQVNGDPTVYANLLLDLVDREAIDKFIVPLENYEGLFKFAPALVPFRGWFDEVRETALLFIAEEEAESEPTEGATDLPSNVQEMPTREPAEQPGGVDSEQENISDTPGDIPAPTNHD